MPCSSLILKRRPRQRSYVGGFDVFFDRRRSDERDGKSRWDCASLLKEERDDGENRVEDERRDREGAIGTGRSAHEGVTCLNQDQQRNENDDADLSRDRAVAFQINDRAEKKNSDLQTELDGSVIPKSEPDFQRVVIDGEIGTMNNQIKKPMRKNGESHQ